MTSDPTNRQPPHERDARVEPRRSDPTNRQPPSGGDARVEPRGSDPTNRQPPSEGDARVEPHSGTAERPTDRIWTIPNLLSVARLVGVPFFLWLLLGPHADLLALVVLMVSGFTDWADGVLARKLNQMSRLGALLDPAVDRLYILATLVGLVLRNVIPLWLAAVIVIRDLILATTLPALKKRGLTGLPVHYLGKAATFCLLYAFPLLLIGSHDSTLATIAKPIAWAFTIWGTGLYVWAGGLYLLQVRQVTRLPALAQPPTGA